MKNLIAILLLAVGLVILTASKKEKKEVFSIKMIENSLSKVGVQKAEKLYASKYETTNFLYVTFLKDLKKSGLNDKYNTAQIDASKWRSTKNNQDMEAYYHTHIAYEKYPVVNISYEGAVLFCEWLTEKYNTAEKRKYKKVLFRLPTKDEWEKAAKGGFKSVHYPWGGLDLTNKRGCTLCNYYELGASEIHFNKETQKYEVMTEEHLKSLAKMTCQVDKYPSNEYGLYNMSGNVKEMIAQKGISKGGSYLSTGYDVRIQSEDTYDSPAHDLGFRYFMVVLEE